MYIVENINEILNDIQTFNEKLTNALIEEQRVLTNLEYETSDQLNPFYDENTNAVERIRHDCALLITNISDCVNELIKTRTLTEQIISTIEKSQNELDDKGVSTLQGLTKNYIRSNKRLFKPKDLRGTVERVMKLNDKEQLLEQIRRNQIGGNFNTKKRRLGRNKKTRRK
jgi:hypothetical protein